MVSDCLTHIILFLGENGRWKKTLETWGKQETNWPSWLFGNPQFLDSLPLVIFVAQWPVAPISDQCSAMKGFFNIYHLVVTNMAMENHHAINR